ncbi:MAG: TonB-dependent receptor [Bacteroidales bacterium]
MNRVKLIAITFFLLLSCYLNAQNGILRGTVYDAVTGDVLPGVTIFLEGTTLGTLTDLDGKFNLSAPEGTYVLRISFISFETLNIKDLQIKAGEVTLLDNLQLKETSVELAEVVITADIVRNTEAAILTIKRKSANVIDGISAANFRKIGDSDAASSMKRVPGVSVEGGKYVYVRGLGDRYTKTILNGMDIPGLDPDRNTLQMDIFPTNVIDNIIVIKSFTADLPADFTGGVVDITLKDFPEEKKGNVSISAGYNPSFHFNENYLTYEGGKTDFLGFDDGARVIPATTDIPFFSEAVSNPNGKEGIRYREILENFNPVMAAHQQRNFMDYTIGLSLGNQVPGNKVTLGYNFALSYKNYSEYYEDDEYGRYGLSGDPDVYEMDVREYQVGDYGISGVMWSGLAGFAVKTLRSKYRINLLHLQNGESRAGIFDYTGSDQGSNFTGFQHNLDYSERSLTNVLIDGKHSFHDSKWNIEWKISPTLSIMYEPDSRFTRYIERGVNLAISTESGFPERIWRYLDEVNLSGVLHFTRELNLGDQKAKLQFGGAYTYKDRSYEILNYALNIRNIPLTGDPNELFLPENMWPYNDIITRGTTYEAAFIPNNPNKFDANTSNMAGYLSIDFNLFKKLKAITGVRFENQTQRYTGQDQLGTIILDNDKLLDDLDLFPTVNLIYSLKNQQNLRLSYAKTIARPSFKELSYAEIFDPISGRVFIGGLFRDANDVMGIEYWDGNLVSTIIHNFDLRWELFMKAGQLISLSGYYKNFIKPIEIVQFASQTGSFQPRNVGDANVFGSELEFRLNLDLIGHYFSNVSLSGNFTYTYSRIKLSKTEYDSRVLNARTGQIIDEYRPMAGQAPYIINVGMSYNGGENGFWSGFEAGLFYNLQGVTLQYVGINDRPDIYSVPFHGLNFNSNKTFGQKKRFQAGFKIENILNDTKASVFKSFEAADQFFTRLDPGISFQVRLSYSFF